MKLLSQHLFPGSAALAVSLLFVMATSAAHAAAEPEHQSTVSASVGANDSAVAEQEVRAMLKLEKYPTITYWDKDGKAITASEFLNHIKSAEPFSMRKELPKDAPGVATLSLDAPKAEVDRSKPVLKFEVGKKFPDFKLKQLDGSVIDNASLTGNYTLINFFFAECSPCIEEIPDLNAFSASHKTMRFIAMTLDSNDDARQFVADHKFMWNVVPDSQDFLQKIGIKIFPSFVLIGPDGAVLGIASAVDFHDKKSNVSAWADRLIGDAQR